MKITVVDSPMGSGKSTWAINYIAQNPEEHFLFITPYNDETVRVKKTLKKMRMDGKTTARIHVPFRKDGAKNTHLIELLEQKESIAATHKLFQMIDPQIKKLIKDGNYTLIIDEALDVVAIYDEFNKQDFEYLIDKQSISMDEEGYIRWHDKLGDGTKYAKIKTLAENRQIAVVDDKVLIWEYPVEILHSFGQIYVLTYLFEASILRCYFDMHDMTYCMKSIGINSTLVDYIPFDPSVYQKLIHIYDGKLNNVGNTSLNAYGLERNYTKMSKTWYEKNTATLDLIKRAVSGYFRKHLKVKARTIMWTTFKPYVTKIKGKGYTSRGTKLDPDSGDPMMDDNGYYMRDPYTGDLIKDESTMEPLITIDKDGNEHTEKLTCYVPCNQRATNDYQDLSNLAYLINLYMNPEIKKFFQQHNVEVNEDLWALSEMIQWIWRSRIRKGDPINIYIPSGRMRLLLKRWLNNDQDLLKSKRDTNRVPL